MFRCTSAWSIGRRSGCKKFGASYLRFQTDALPRGSGITVQVNATDGRAECRFGRMRGEALIGTSRLLPETPHREPVEVGVDVVLVLVGIDSTNSCDVMVSVL